MAICPVRGRVATFISGVCLVIVVLVSDWCISACGVVRRVVSLGAIFMSVVSWFISGLLYLYPFMVTGLTVPNVIPVGFV